MAIGDINYPYFPSRTKFDGNFVAIQSTLSSVVGLISHVVDKSGSGALNDPLNPFTIVLQSAAGPAALSLADPSVDSQNKNRVMIVQLGAKNSGNSLAITGGATYTENNTVDVPVVGLVADAGNGKWHAFLANGVTIS